MGRSGKILAYNDIVILDFINNPYYKVENDGSIWTRYARSGYFIKDGSWRRCDVSKGQNYRTVSYKFKNKRVILQAHRIVYAKYLGKLEVDLVINHKDSDPSNNHPSNLELVTQRQNNLHCTNKDSYKPIMGNTILNWQIVRSIREEHKNGSSYSILSKKYGISKGHISSLINNKTWIEGKEYY